MKTITMDWADYLDELRNERIRGFNLLRELEMRVQNLIYAIENDGSSGIIKNKTRLCELLSELREPEIYKQMHTEPK